jgi:hypothetical protein
MLVHVLRVLLYLTFHNNASSSPLLFDTVHNQIKSFTVDTNLPAELFAKLFKGGKGGKKGKKGKKKK